MKLSFLVLVVIIVLCIKENISEDASEERPVTSRTPYCQIGCGFLQSSVCYTRCTRKKCKIIEPNLRWRTSVVNKINEIRQKFAIGLNSLKKKAANMNIISYDMHLEFAASCWIGASDKPLNEDPCPRTKTFRFVGQNIWQKSRSPPQPQQYDDFVRHVMDDWFHDGELPSLTYSKYDKADGNTTQLAWAKTTHIGCAACTDQKLVKVACNFAIMGRLHNAKVFEEGEPASNCGGNITVNKYIKTLCGELKYEIEFWDKNTIWASSTKLYLNNYTLLLVLVNYYFCLFTKA